MKIAVIIAPEGLPVAIFVLGSNLFLAYACRRHYGALGSARIEPPASSHR
jgi:hypothetical protein